VAKKPALQFSIPEEERVEAPVSTPSVVAEPNEKEAPKVPSYRIGRKNLSVWIDQKAFNQFKALVAEKGMTMQEYMVKMLNEEFRVWRSRPQAVNAIRQTALSTS
jgi:hypothetical protein